MNRQLSNDPKPAERESHWILWTVVTIFIVCAIGGLWAVDYLYSPEMISEKSVPDAVGK